jgi:tRNA (cmo5U34)-methyltransferase
MSEDRIYRRPLAQISPFRFDDRVAEVFPDMLRRSVPGYAGMIDMIGVLAGQQAVVGGRFYDLGCSLGAATAVMRSALGNAQAELIAVDNAPAMIDRARELLQAQTGPPVALRCEDIRDTEVEQADMVVLNLTLQFVPPAERLELLTRIRRGLDPGGVLVLSEKIAGADAAEQRLMTELHHAFKRANGYSDLEISQKRSALEEVLIPETLAEHESRLHAAGFSRVDLWYRCLNFASVLARP